MRTLARFRYSDDICVPVAFLEAHGIPRFVPDEILVRMNWFYCQAIGELRLQVFDQDYEEAR